MSYFQITQTDSGIVYAELELKPGAGPTVRPTVKVENDKTEYAEIVHVKQEKDSSK